MKFSEMSYERPDIEATAADLRELLASLSNADSVQEQTEVINQINHIRSHVSAMYNLCYIRNTINTQDEFYKQEKRFFDENMPQIEGVDAEYYRVLLDSPFRSELESAFGSQLFRIAESTVKTFALEIIADLQRENELSTEYNALIASAQIPFQGQEFTLSQLVKYLNDPDREVRKAAGKAKYAFFESHEGELDRIYDDFVRTRTAMARKLGHKNFTELGYLKLNRTDYDAASVK